MKKFLIQLLICLGIVSFCYADWNSSTDPQDGVETVSSYMTKIRNNFLSIDGTSGTAPTTVVANSAVKVAPLGVSLTGSNGTVTFLGLGDGFDENLVLDFNTTTNIIGISSGTSVSTVDFGTIDLGTDALDVSDGNITNVGDIALDSLSPDASTISVTSSNNATLLSCNASGTGAGDAYTFTSSLTGQGIYLNTIGIQATGSYSFFIYSNAILTNATTGLAMFSLDNASSTMPVILINNSGSGVQIQGEGNENLSNAGVWTDRTSLFSDKENIVELTTPTYIEKLKNTKLYSYIKKSEKYGNKIDVLSDIETIDAKDEINPKSEKYIGNDKYILKGNKYHKVVIQDYPNKIINSHPKEYVGIILDNPSTPEELISRDLNGNINGKSGTQIAEFNLVVTKELINEVEKLKADFEKYKIEHP